MSTERDHLDAETVAAWMDDGLDSASRAAAEAHASNCERCQMLLVTTAKTLPVGLKADTSDRAVVSGFSRTNATSPTSTQVVSGFGRIRWWMAPIAAAAAAVTVWMVIPREMPQPSSTPQQESKVADARDAIAPAAPEPQRSPATNQAAPPAPSAPAESPSSDRERQRFAESAGARVGGLTDAAARDQDTAAKRESTLARADAANAQAPTSAPAAAEPVPAAPAPPAATSERRAEPLQESVATAQLTKQTAATIEVVSPNPASRWRIAQGFLERSEDGGTTWLPMRPVARDQIRGGSSPSELVCWLVGARGLVLLATDGTNFTRVRFPEQIDLATVTASSAAAAAITTTDGRTFITTDSGRTWRNK